MRVDTAVDDLVLARIPQGPWIQRINGVQRSVDSGTPSALHRELVGKCIHVRSARLYDVTGLCSSSAVAAEQVQQPEIPGGYLVLVLENDLCRQIIGGRVSTSDIVGSWRVIFVCPEGESMDLI